MKFIPMTGKPILVVLLLCVALGAFAGDTIETAQEDVAIKIAYPVAVDAPITEILNGYTEKFMEANPGITVETVYAGGYGDVKTMVQTSIEGGGEAPALAVMLATDLFDLANAQYIDPIGELVDEMADADYLADFLPAFMANSNYMDKLWSLPFQRSAVVMYYNADLLKEAGLAVPDSWESLGETAAALTLRGAETISRWGIEWPSDWPYWLFQPLAIGAGQNIVGDSDTQVYFNNDPVIDAIEYYIMLSQEYQAMPKGVQGSWGNVVPNFLAGNTAFIVHSSGSLSRVLKEATFEVGVSGVPGPNKGPGYSVPGGGNLYMTAGQSAAEQKAAIKLAMFLTQPENVADFSINTGYIAHRKAAFSDAAMVDYVAANPQAGQMLSILAQAGKELALQNLGEVRNIFHKYLQAAINGEMSAADAMKVAQEEAEKALEAFR